VPRRSDRQRGGVDSNQQGPDAVIYERSASWVHSVRRCGRSGGHFRRRSSAPYCQWCKSFRHRQVRAQERSIRQTGRLYLMASHPIRRVRQARRAGDRARAGYVWKCWWLVPESNKRRRNRKRVVAILLQLM
jgi:hypothetical protein